MQKSADINKYICTFFICIWKIV